MKKDNTVTTVTTRCVRTADRSACRRRSASNSRIRGVTTTDLHQIVAGSDLSSNTGNVESHLKANCATNCDTYNYVTGGP